MFVDAEGKEFDSIQGRRATVVHDDMYNFEDGQVVIILEDENTPYCVPIENYMEGCNSIDDYGCEMYNPLNIDAELIIEGDEE